MVPTGKGLLLPSTSSGFWLRVAPGPGPVMSVVGKRLPGRAGGAHTTHRGKSLRRSSGTFFSLHSSVPRDLRLQGLEGFMEERRPCHALQRLTQHRVPLQDSGLPPNTEGRQGRRQGRLGDQARREAPKAWRMGRRRSGTRRKGRAEEKHSRQWVTGKR